MKITPLISFIILSTALSACSSKPADKNKNGANSASQSSQTAQQPNTSTPSTSKPSSPAKPTPTKPSPATPNPTKPSNPVGNVKHTLSGDFDGLAYQFKSGSAANKIKNVKLLELKTHDINTLNVDNRTIALFPKGVNPAYSFTENNGEFHLGTGAFLNGVPAFSDVRNGIYQNTNNNTTYVYIQGNRTAVANMPTSGKATYTGLGSFHITNDSLNSKTVAGKNPPKWEIIGTMLNVDFDAKKIDGSLLHTAYTNHIVAKLEGKITGNTFEGKKDGTEMKGAFFGKNANELGAIYANEQKGFAGSFSAKAKW